MSPKAAPRLNQLVCKEEQSGGRYHMILLYWHDIIPIYLVPGTRLGTYVHILSGISHAEMTEKITTSHARATLQRCRAGWLGC